MIEELEKANVHADDRPKMLPHINSIRLLCDILLAEEGEGASASSNRLKEKITLEEKKAMFGDDISLDEPESNDGANGKSIFDF